MPKLLRSWTILINGSGMFNLAILFNLKRPNKLSVKFILYSGHLFTTLLFFVYYRTTTPERSSEGTRTGIQTRPMSAFLVTLIPTPSRREGSIGALLPATHPAASMGNFLHARARGMSTWCLVYSHC
jgi:hypothetical protein